MLKTTVGSSHYLSLGEGGGGEGGWSILVVAP